jgi:hypothetical protein
MSSAPQVTQLLLDWKNGDSPAQQVLLNQKLSPQVKAAAVKQHENELCSQWVLSHNAERCAG